MNGRALIIRTEEQTLDGWDDPLKGRVSWRTLFSGGTTATEALTAGVAELQPGDRLGLHRHTPPEIYYVLEGSGIVTLDGVEHEMAAGAAVFIPGDCEHGVRNDGASPLRLFYAFAVNSFGEVEYRFS